MKVGLLLVFAGICASQQFPYDIWEHDGGYDGYTPALMYMAQDILKQYINELPDSQRDAADQALNTLFENAQIEDPDGVSTGQHQPLRLAGNKTLLQRMTDFLKRAVTKY
eukprot:Blabericola_migrator_1__5860@NODE_2969_length_2153_cov_4_539789_g1859_i0_p2_GENE_NODE_2969_length_2153_cov_4_539789_g1859_i0NODE_2969_length_2153_cov_4_539789_g1859_i0_p2_ORF_typecomplete_len110_score14_88DUF1108/PF06531_11/0_17_NODE_2969_length_2153_cov_4_539789_g1859_i090419